MMYGKEYRHSRVTYLQAAEAVLCGSSIIRSKPELP